MMTSPLLMKQEASVPRVSVVLPVYNGQLYLKEAIESLLSQSYRDFELLIINDGSTDDSEALVGELDDPRIRYFKQANRGLAATLNRAISLARGQYIARQDQDDICFTHRLRKQATYLDKNPEVAIVGSAAEIWVGNEKTSRLLSHPVDDESIRFGLLFDNYFVHSSVMIRKSVLEEAGGYTEDKSRQPPEDYELWSRVMRTHKVANLPEVLMAYREVSGSMSRIGANPFLHNLIKISAENIAWASGREAGSPEVVALSKLMHGDYEGMPRGISYSNMRLILNQSMLRISIESGVAPRRMTAIARGRLSRLRYRFVDYRCGGFIGTILNGRLGSYAQKMAKRLLMKGFY